MRSVPLDFGVATGVVRPLEVGISADRFTHGAATTMRGLPR